MLRSVNGQNGLFIKFSGDVNSRYFVEHPLLEISIQSAWFDENCFMEQTERQRGRFAGTRKANGLCRMYA